MLDAAAALADDPDVVFVINGGERRGRGSRRPPAGLSNVRFVDLQPMERLPEVLAAGRHPRGAAQARPRPGPACPSKLYSILAAGRPVLASVDRGTEVASLVERSGAGVSVPPEDPEAFTKAAHPPRRRRPTSSGGWASPGRRFVEQWASPAAVAEQYEALFEGLRRRRG